MSDLDLFETSSEATTRGVRVLVRARYSAEHSSPPQSRWFFLYTITIANTGRYGALRGKAVTMDPAGGFVYESPLEPRR